MSKLTSFTDETNYKGRFVKSGKLKQAARMIWVSNKYVSVLQENGKSKTVKVPVQGTYIRAKHGPIGVELDRINQLKERQNEQ